jgi:hypothetical protein
MIKFTIPVRRFARLIKSNLPELNFITLHYMYFIGTCLISAVVFWGSSTPSRSISFTDSLFFAVSAMTEAGLNTVNLSQLNTWQQVILFILIMLGGSTWVSISVVYIRRRAFEIKFMTEMEKEQRLGRRIMRTISKARTTSVSAVHLPISKQNRLILTKDGQMVPEDVNGNKLDTPEIEPLPPDVIDTELQQAESASINTKNDANDLANKEQSETNQTENDDTIVEAPTVLSPTAITFADETRFGRKEASTVPKRPTNRLFDLSGVGAHSSSHRRYSIQGSSTSIWKPPVLSRRPTGYSNVLSELFTPAASIGRNSNFFELSFDDREKLGGLEYRAVIYLSWLIPLYFLAFHLLGAISLGAYVASYYSSTARENGLNPW